VTNTPRAHADRVAAEARRALRVRRAVIIASALLLAPYFLVVTVVLGVPGKPGPAVPGMVFGVTVLAGLVLLAMINTALVRVVSASGERIAHSRIAGFGHVVFAAVFVTGIFAGNVVEMVMAEREPAQRVTATVWDCSGRGACAGTWEVAGQLHSGSLPVKGSNERVGEQIQMEVSANDPEVVLTPLDPLRARYVLWGSLVVTTGLGVVWARRLRRANGVLREAAGQRTG
jgi:hypothetical protein